MSQSVKLNFQPLPNLPYVQGYPGIIGSPYRKAPAVQGLLEVRVGKEQIKAKQIQIEFIQVEHLPGSTQVVASPIGSPINVWSAENGKDWDFVKNADYRFYIPLPLNLPGSVELKQKGGAIRYELQANFFHKPKSGLLRKETTPITQVIKPIYIGKMELLPAWPIYNIPEVRQTVFDEMELVVTRPYTAFGPGDRIEVHATLRCSRPKPLKVRSFILTMHEILTIRLPSQKGVRQNAVTRTKVVHEAKVPVNEKIARSEEMRRTIPMVVPAGLVANTIRNGRAIELQYELSVKAVMEGMGDPKIEHLACVIGTVPRARAHDIVNQIGFVESLCPASAGGGRPASIRSNSTFAASMTGITQAGLQYGVPGSAYDSPAVSPPPTLTTPPGLQNRSSYYGNTLYATPPVADLASVRSRPQSSFYPRPLSADASSLYSRRQSQSEISSLRDPRADYLPPPRSGERPQSYATFGQSSNEVMNLPPDTRRMTYLGAGMHQYSHMTQSSLSVERPEGPVRMGSYASQVPSVRSRDIQESPAMRSNSRSAQGRLSTDSKSVYVPQSPRPRSFVHTDAGRVLLTETGQPLVETQTGTEPLPSSTADQSRWAAAESEKQRLYVDARRRAALTQLAGGGELASMGLDELPQEEPPSYSPRDPASEHQQSTGSTSIVITSTIDRRSGSRASASSTAYPGMTREHIHTSENPQNESGYAPHNAEATLHPDAPGFQGTTRPDFLESSAGEKERMRMLFEQQDRQQGISSRPSASSLGHTSGNSSCMAAPPTTAHGTRSADFMSADTEKDIMRRRYEAATRAVSGGHPGSLSSRSSFQGHSPRQSSIASSHDNSQGSHFAYQTAQEEKDQMRTRYEEAVHATSSLRIESEQLPTPLPDRYASADEEKSMMRQRYEEAVAAAERQHSQSSANTLAGPSRAVMTSPSHGAGVPGERSGTSIGSGSSTKASHDRSDSYLSAAQEKEQMRLRYEAAVRAQNVKPSESHESDSGHFRPARQVEREQRSVERVSSQPPPLPARPPEVEQYKAIISSPTEEMANPFFYMNSGMIPMPMPMYPVMFPGSGAFPNMDYTQPFNSNHPSPQDHAYQPQ